MSSQEGFDCLLLEPLPLFRIACWLVIGRNGKETKAGAENSEAGNLGASSELSYPCNDFQPFHRRSVCHHRPKRVHGQSI
jgi:hypothetical protein